VQSFTALHDHADGNQSIRIQAKTLEFLPTGLSTLSLYLRTKLATYKNSQEWLDYKSQSLNDT